MNIKWFIIITFIFYFIIFYSCKDKKEEQQIPEDPTFKNISFNFKLLDTLRKEKTEFKDGENIIFNFQIRNTGKKSFYLENFFDCNYNFLKVEKILPDGSKINFGQPYDIIDKVGGFFIPKESIYYIEQQWYGNLANTLNNNNPIFAATEKKHLTPGEYICSFSQSFRFYFITNSNIRDSIIFENKQFEVKFSIKD